MVGHEMRHGLGAGVSAVRGAEGVVDVDVGERGQSAGQRVVVVGLSGFEAHVLQHQHVAGLEVVGQGLDLGPHHARGERDVGAGELRQPVGGGAQREPRHDLALRAAEVRGEHQPRPAPAQLLDRRQSRADARVVGHLAVLQRNVEVDPHENAPILDVHVVEGLHRSFWTSSTMRFE